MPFPIVLSAAALRRELSARNLHRAAALPHETTCGQTPSVVYAPDPDGVAHGNFLSASYRRILADEAWRQRLSKAWTAGSRMARRHDRRRGELECAASSDALLMNLFCYPGATSRPGLCRLLGIEPGARPEFGLRVHIPLRRELFDQTEMDMALAGYLVEAKLTEGGFGTARTSLLLRYRDLDEVFDIEDLPRSGDAYAGYQLVRGVLAASACSERYLLLCDARRADLMESWFRVVRAIRSSDLRSRVRLATWQEIAATMPAKVRRFLAEKYGISTAAEKTGGPRRFTSLRSSASPCGYSALPTPRLR